MNDRDLARLIDPLRALTHETEWVEFKENNASPEEIGENISALANSAALHEQPVAYLVWGVEDRTHAVVGTSFRPRERKIGNEALENWLLHQLTPRIDLRFPPWPPRSECVRATCTHAWSACPGEP
jgi:ATP-dependent DNA helicase RecG